MSPDRCPPVTGRPGRMVSLVGVTSVAGAGSGPPAGPRTGSGHVPPRTSSGQAPGPAPGPAPGIPTGRPRGRRPSRAEVAVTLVAGSVFAYQVGRPSPWWDEGVTRDVVSRPVADILALAGNVDLVHVAYYLLMHALVGGDAGFTALRTVSVVAAALTAGLLVRIGRQLHQPPVGVCAGLLFAAMPLASRYAQEARSYALVTLLATASTVALLAAVRQPWRRRRWVLYAALVAAAGLLNLLSVLVLLPHLVHVVTAADRPTRKRWLLAGTGAATALLPLVVGASRQGEQLDWLPRPDLDDLTHFLMAQYAAGLMSVLLVALAVAGLRSRDGHPRTHRETLVLGLAWALLPPVVLWTVSQVHPLYDWRYVVFCLPGSALAIASLATQLRPAGTAVVVVALAVGGLHMNEVYRRPAIGHAEDIRGTAQVIGQEGQPGDGVLFLPASRRLVALAYPEYFAEVDDLALRVSPTASRTLFGEEVGPSALAAALRNRQRVWVVTGDPRLGEVSTTAEVEKRLLLASSYRLVSTRDLYRFRVELYVRPAPVAPTR